MTSWIYKQWNRITVVFPSLNLSTICLYANNICNKIWYHAICSSLLNICSHFLPMHASISANSKAQAHCNKVASLVTERRLAMKSGASASQYHDPVVAFFLPQPQVLWINHKVCYLDQTRSFITTLLYMHFFYPCPIIVT
jgi:hypothetical protein